MSSTNKTTYYALSQYIGTDKPTYLGDYNSDMSKIDAGIHQVQETATTANQTAGSAEAKVTQVITVANQNSKDISDLQTSVASINSSNVTRDSNISKAQAAAITANDNATDAQKSITRLSNNVSLWEEITNGSGNVLARVNRTLRIIDINAVFGGTGDSSRRVLFNIPNISPTKDIEFIGNVVDNANAVSTLAIEGFKLKTNGDVVFNDGNNATPYNYYGCRLNNTIAY